MQIKRKERLAGVSTEEVRHCIKSVTAWKSEITCHTWAASSPNLILTTKIRHASIVYSLSRVLT